MHFAVMSLIDSFEILNEFMNILRQTVKGIQTILINRHTTKITNSKIQDYLKIIHMIIFKQKTQDSSTQTCPSNSVN